MPSGTTFTRILAERVAERGSGRYYHKVRGRGKAKLCHLWLPPAHEPYTGDAYWHMCRERGSEVVTALTIPTSDGIVEVPVKGRDDAYKIEATMRELKARAKTGLLTRKDFDFYSTPGGDYNQSIDLLLLDLGVEPQSDELIALRDYAQHQVQKNMGPRGAPKRILLPRTMGDTLKAKEERRQRGIYRRPVRVRSYRRR